MSTRAPRLAKQGEPFARVLSGPLASEGARPGMSVDAKISATEVEDGGGFCQKSPAS